MSDLRQISDEYAEIGGDLVQTDPLLKYIRDSDVRIV